MIFFSSFFHLYSQWELLTPPLYRLTWNGIVYRISQWKVNDKNILENTFQSFQIMGPKSSDFYSPEEKKNPYWNLEISRGLSRKY